MSTYHEFAKNVRIMNDLLFFCNKLGVTDCEISLKLEDNIYHCCICCPITYLNNIIIDELRQTLGRPRQKEIEQSYWSLSGEDNIETELTLVGMMIDEVSVEYSGQELKIHCIRYIN